MDDAATFDDILYELYLIYKVDLGLIDVKEGRTLSHQDVLNELARRFQLGPPPPDSSS